ncbi:MAG TPA: ABC transporter permease [Kiritimatiellia bacterium]|nr:ABC transporter permease [Kiritimatiellia bacterium]HRZ12832.1 ABC transporter permease [Kiritimatiellia bacterium]HSA18216.1 ABC transporter permease [Kiritimatiellia bacterium]
MKRSVIPLLTTLFVLVFFYLPIVVLVVNSFNASRFGGTWEGSTLEWYRMLFRETSVWRALRNTLIIAVGATFASVVLGTTAAFALHRYHTRLQRLHYTLIYTPLVVPEILMGMSLLLFFVAAGFELGLFTIFLAHTTFCISYVAMVVLARLQDFDFSIIEAAQDLGAGWWTTAWRVLLPLLAPGLAAGGLLAFTLSIDDFVITFFVSGPGSTTLPVRIYSMIKHSKNMPMINALSAILLVVTFAAVWGSQRLTKESHA